MKKAPRSSVGQPLVTRDSATDSSEESVESNKLDESVELKKSEESAESDTIASRVQEYRPNPKADPVRRQKDREEEQRKKDARKVEDKKVFDGLERRYKRQAAENETQLMTRI